MGQVQNKYHIADNGKIYKVCDDGSVTAIGHINDIEKRPSSSENIMQPPSPISSLKSTKPAEVAWWKKKTNTLWKLSLFLFIAWYLVCLPFSIYYEPINDFGGVIYCDNMIIISERFIVICILFSISWYISQKQKKWLQVLHIIFLMASLYVGSYIIYFVEYELLILGGTLPFLSWITSIYLSTFRRK